MQLLITGGTGLIGRHLIQRLLLLSHSITVVTRNPERARSIFGDRVEYWSTLDDKTSLNAFDGVINLAGEPIADKRWTPKQKQRLSQSRWDITERLARLIKDSSEPPSVFISGSAVGYYGDQGAALVTEEETPTNDFTHHLCARWEALAQSAESDKTRVCLLRTGVVLSAQGGALAKMLPLFRLGLGGPLGSGKQYMPWIHIDDMVNGIIYLLDSDVLSGPFNMVSPYPVRNEQFSALLAEVLHRPGFLRAPGFAIKLLMGEAATLVLGGQRAIPARLESAGFGFRFFELKEALEEVTKKPG
ncbi:TIGR01777 family oxidoreductase [Brenneria goodwinii]|uniref:TIGR01777 family oxidoreductase n=1 Tax=Brenneria goodwinii TaxID=1109412 RepID=UPI000EF18DA9|nr:TIGR01777 family oxidoreductase [Brenneria goodwinii]MCG8157463.1 TIGR01777 family oxidoreductase [Brenneria goodwinii]MCG8162036.1 TIGR01777 family oxidoreductase [Brenneria goodwinii]MCG8165277.1 TIGR01777 family oxidoreductase [Brenneria goodwinii]MCG8170974.1 TIGR01777 family oxidoreductase [Brenneria goodwinii]MCG8176060.1 TIGR01777 family oxidoreductase [Brenneria goodwinii]